MTSKRMLGSILILLFAAVSLGQASKKASPAIDRSKFEALYRAGKALGVASLSDVPTIRRLNESLELELSIAGDKARSGPETKLVLAYQNVWITAIGIANTQETNALKVELSGVRPTLSEVAAQYVEQKTKLNDALFAAEEIYLGKAVPRNRSVRKGGAKDGHSMPEVR